MECTKAILVVSFGTSYTETRKKTIEAIENEIRTSFPDRRIYRAWTSKKIIQKLKNRDGLQIDTVAEALTRMHADGIKEVVIQPTHVMSGFENDAMEADVEAQKAQFASLSYGAPLLSSREDLDAMADLLAEAFASLSETEALILMGHGTEHQANTVYTDLNETLKGKGLNRFFVATVEAHPGMDEIRAFLKDLKPTRVVLTPFMIVAGDHANHDMAGADEDSWKSILEGDGYRVDCVLKGLGEYEAVRRRFALHAGRA